MILRNLTFSHDLPFEPDHIHTMEIHSPRLFGRTVQSLLALSNKEEPTEPFLFLENSITVDPSKNLFVVTDPFHLDLNSRKNLTALYNRVEKALVSDQLLHSRFRQLMLEACDITGSLTATLDADTHYSDELTISAFLKAIDLQFDCKPYAEPKEQLYTLLDIAAEFMPEKLLVLCNIAPFLGEDSWHELMKYALYHKLKLLNIEQQLPEELGLQEIRWIINSDYDDEIRR